MKQKMLRFLFAGVGLTGAFVIGALMASANRQRALAEQEDRSFEVAPAKVVPIQPVIEDRRRAVGQPVPTKKAVHQPRAKRESDGESVLPAIGGPFGPHQRRTIMRQRPVVDKQGNRTFINEWIEVTDPYFEKKAALNQSIREDVEIYQTTPNDDIKREIEEKIELHLGELFDLQQQEREAQLKPMEDRVKKLREALNKRAAMRKDLVQLRVKVLLQDADGLGWGPDEFLTPTRNPENWRDPNQPASGYYPQTNDNSTYSSPTNDDTYRSPLRREPEEAPAVDDPADLESQTNS